MFRLSAKSDYGLILLSSLRHSTGRMISISTIAKKNRLSPKFLSQVAGELRRAGIISAREGVSGGYQLTKKPDDIKILDVLKILDGDLVSGGCFNDDHECNCGGKEMFSEMKKQLEDSIRRKTVADLVT